MTRATTALAPWFGSNRIGAANVGELLKGCRWVGVLFAGGMCELNYIDAPSIVVNDKHRDVINLAEVVKSDYQRSKLMHQLRWEAFHPDALAAAQARCKASEPPDDADFERACDYFVACWMGRSHKSGVDDEFNGGISIRWNGNGGDSNTRYRSALRSLASFGRIMRRCNFTTMDALEMIDRAEDNAKHGLYADPPFPGPGDRYKYKFTIQQHRDMAKKLATFKHTRVVCRFYDVPLIRELYPESHWTWNHFEGRKQTNDAAPEVLLANTREQPSLFTD